MYPFPHMELEEYFGLPSLSFFFQSYWNYIAPGGQGVLGPVTFEVWHLTIIFTHSLRNNFSRVTNPYVLEETNSFLINKE